MAIRDDLRGICYIALKDMKAYYLKPSAISWGILLPIALGLAFYLRSPEGFRDLVPGLVAMAVLFSTTAMEAVVIDSELRIGALERLFSAPISTAAVLMGKVLGAVLFGLAVSLVVTIVSVVGLGLLQWSLLWLLPVLLLSALVFSGLGAFIAVSVREVFKGQTVANFVRFPMIFLCGVFSPLSSLPLVLRGIAYLLPLTYTVEGIQNAVASFSLGAILVDLLVLVAFAALFLALALVILRRRLA